MRASNIGFAIALSGALGFALPAIAQTTTTPDKLHSSPAGRDAQGHATDATTPSAHPSTTVYKPVKDSSGAVVGSEAIKAEPNRTPMNTVPGAGLRNAGNERPPTSGAAGR